MVKPLRPSWRSASAVALVGAVVVPLAAHAGPPRSRASEIRRIEQQTEQIRGLKAERPVQVRFPSDRAFNAVVTANVRRGDPESAVQVSQRESVVLGLLNKRQNLHKILFSDLDNQVVGLYDRDRKVLYVRRNGGQAFGIERYNIAHEYTHALQDQHWNLGKLLPDQNRLRYRNSDRVSAHHALTEGDAVVTQTLFIEEHYSSREIAQLRRLSSRPAPGPPLPKSIQRQFYFPYTTGVRFAQTLYLKGGMRAVDAAYQRLPSSTYEIMHPTAYLHHWKPVSVPLHGVRGFNGWKQVDDDVFGAFGYDVLIWQFTSRRLADRVTDAYRGDRYIFLERGAQNAMLLESVWTSPAAARSARAAIVRSLKVRFGNGGHWSDAGGGLREPNGGAFIRLSGARLFLAYGPDLETARRLALSPAY